MESMRPNPIKRHKWPNKLKLHSVSIAIDHSRLQTNGGTKQSYKKVDVETQLSPISTEENSN